MGTVLKLILYCLMKELSPYLFSFSFIDEITEILSDVCGKDHRINITPGNTIQEITYMKNLLCRVFFSYQSMLKIMQLS